MGRLIKIVIFYLGYLLLKSLFRRLRNLENEVTSLRSEKVKRYQDSIDAEFTKVS